jgi:hypothetical protein
MKKIPRSQYRSRGMASVKAVLRAPLAVKSLDTGLSASTYHSSYPGNVKKALSSHSSR